MHQLHRVYIASPCLWSTIGYICSQFLFECKDLCSRTEYLNKNKEEGFVCVGVKEIIFLNLVWITWTSLEVI